MRNPIPFFVLCFLLTLSLTSHSTQNSLDHQISTNISSTTSTITFLSSQESISSGIYKVGDQSNSPSEFFVFKLPFRHQYKKHEDGSQYSMLIGYGRFGMRQNHSTENGKTKSLWEAQTLSAGIGRSAPLFDIYRWFTTLEMAYTSINHDYQKPSNVSPHQTSEQFADLNFDWQTNTVSLIPTIGLDLPFLPYLTAWHYKPKIIHVATESVLTNNKIQRIRSESTVFENKIEFGNLFTPSFGSWNMQFSPYLARVDLSGEINKGLKTDFWYKVGTKLKLNTSEDKWWNGLSYGITYIHAEKIRGGQLLLTLDYSNLLSGFF